MVLIIVRTALWNFSVHHDNVENKYLTYMKHIYTDLNYIRTNILLK
jgi:hypothetical protein